jgi:hypothetical protein
MTVQPTHFFAGHTFRTYFGLRFADTALAAPDPDGNGDRGAMAALRGFDGIFSGIAMCRSMIRRTGGRMSGMICCSRLMGCWIR